ncbi:MAG: hypothetical protein R3C68_07710 [Myxococcota bacterium]
MARSTSLAASFEFYFVTGLNADRCWVAAALLVSASAKVLSGKGDPDPRGRPAHHSSAFVAKPRQTHKRSYRRLLGVAPAITWVTSHKEGIALSTAQNDR